MESAPAVPGDSVRGLPREPEQRLLPREGRSPGTRRPVLPSSRLSAAELRHLTVGYVCFGTETSVDPGALGAYHVNLPTFGAVESHCWPRGTITTPGHAAVFTPSEHTYLPRWAADAEQICVKISTSALEAELEGLLGHPVGTSVRFDLDFSLTSGAGRSWLSTVKLLLSELADRESLVHRSERHREHLESMVVDGVSGRREQQGFRWPTSGASASSARGKTYGRTRVP
ncbi:hypothetical protein [Amycolatopsis sp. NPDC001319]|uniref:cupin domain-containing protein n=1 Tax=unclassified Amycolatopsis TaxID=2618356 RepID=UPI00368086AA